MASGELACTYAALILSDDGIAITAEKIATIVKAANIKVESYWPALFAKLLRSATLRTSSSPLDLVYPPLALKILLYVHARGGGAAPVAAAAPSGGAAAAAAPAAEEKKEEVKEESDDDMGFSLFD
ncbi:unnamed protein product [Miscanthus lutarioriparius]|uniref:60S acidic ribosomal protein P1 n=1 Tax=Miscanthus lutarioriparius TaxID=422564 RepID=A0A811R8F2_9POAL|nr:unnamed protein product [Miscanthus lutarioriparius]